VKRRKRLTEYEAKIYTAQVVKAIIYIHSQSIIHRDLKLGNILINDNMETKICDFGLSTRVKNEGEIKKTICGTPNYIAPEILD
jgi:serine/threonine protein kinase